ncbi:unnamed protein product, partial [Polarella glacialis]
MDVEALLASPKLASLDEAVLAFARDALLAVDSAEDAAEIIGPFLLDSGVVVDEAEILELCRRFCSREVRTKSPSLDLPQRMSCSLQPLGALFRAAPQFQEEDEAEWMQAASGSVDRASSSKGGPTRGLAARKAAQAAAGYEAALLPGARLELRTATSESAAADVARGLRACPEWGAISGGERTSVDYLAASFLAYSEDRHPESLKQWASVLCEVLEDAGEAMDLDEGDDLQSASLKVVQQLAKRGILQAKKRTFEPGDLVLAFLPEDGEWHHAMVERLLEEGLLGIVFIEYGKPQQVQSDDVRAMEDVADDGEGELQEGDCEMCKRSVLLTFHHLIPKDKHPTYLGRRLPKGIEGEPTRGFLNSYGLMICRPCHNTVHRLASNEVL